MLRTNLLPSPLSTCKSDADVNPLAPICWRRVDYNANINWIVAGQPDGRKVNVINSFYVKFERHGWIVEAVYIGNPMRHDEKYLLINQTFAGKQRAKGDNRKDKAGEKLAVSEEDLLEHRTDGTDAFDTVAVKSSRSGKH